MEIPKYTAREKIPADVRKKVILFFNTYKDNSTKTIADFYNLNFRTVNRIIDGHLKKIRNQLYDNTGIEKD